MITINLLGEGDKLSRRQLIFLMRWGLAAVVATSAVFAGYVVTGLTRNRIQAEIHQVEISLNALRSSTRGAAQLPRRGAEIAAQLEVISMLKRNKRAPVRTLDTLSAALPERAWFTQIREQDRALRIEGVAADDQIVAEFIGSLERSGIFGAIDLIESKVLPKDGVNLRQFSIDAKTRSGSTSIRDAVVGRGEVERAKSTVDR